MTTQVKKQFVELVNFLEENKDKKVSSILKQVLEMVESKKKDSTIRTDESGRITHIFCYYHKEWEPVEWYGKKASSHSGYNTMCREGVNQWTKREADYKKAHQAVLAKLLANEIDNDTAKRMIEQIEKEKTVIVPREEYLKAKQARELAKQNAAE